MNSKMKKLNILAMGILMAAGFTSCSESSYDDIYPDPSKSTTASCASLMTGTFYNHDNPNNFQASVHEYTYNSYWRLYTWENAFGRFAQTIGYQNESGSIYYLSDSYANNRWDYFYRMLAQFRPWSCPTFRPMPSGARRCRSQRCSRVSSSQSWWLAGG